MTKPSLTSLDYAVQVLTYHVDFIDLAIRLAVGGRLPKFRTQNLENWTSQDRRCWTVLAASVNYQMRLWGCDRRLGEWDDTMSAPRETAVDWSK